MKILMISDFYPPFIGGMCNYVQTLSKNLVKKGHQVIVCSIGNKWLSNLVNNYGVKVIRFEGFFQSIPFLFKNLNERYPPPIRDFCISRKLEKIIIDEKPDIIHAHGWLLYSLLECKKNFGIPLIVTLHDYGYICPKKNLLKGNSLCNKFLTIECINCARNMYGIAKSTFLYYSLRLNKRKLMLVDKYIAVSSFVKDLYSKQLNINDNKITIIPNFIEQDKHVSCLKRNIIYDDFILFVGALSPHKGVNILIKAYEKLNTKTKLVLIGKKVQDYSFKSTNKIKIIENAPSHIIIEAYMKCRFVVIPSIWPEPFGLVALEAMSYNKAIIASNIGGLKDIIINKKTGILIPPYNISKLKDAMQYLLENPSTAKEMGNMGYAYFIKKYVPDVVIPQIENIYTNLHSNK